MNNDDDITFTLDTSTANDTITIDTSGFDSMAQSTFSIGTIDDDFDVSSITFNDPVEFEDVLPSMSKISLMCAEYPALEQAYEKFKHIYNLVKDDYNDGEDNELPF